MSDGRVDEVCELAAVPAVREADEVAEERRVRPLAALVGRHPRELEELVHLDAREIVGGVLLAHLLGEPRARLLAAIRPWPQLRLSPEA